MSNETLLLGTAAGLLIFSAGAAAALFMFWRNISRRAQLAAADRDQAQRLAGQRAAIEEAAAATRRMMTIYQPWIDAPYDDEEGMIRIVPAPGWAHGDQWSDPEKQEQIADRHILDRKQELVFSLAYSECEGWASYRKIYDAAREFNEKMRAAGAGKFALSESFIRDTLEQWTYDPESNGALIGLYLPEEKRYQYFALTFDHGNGGETRRLVPIGELVDTWLAVRREGLQLEQLADLEPERCGNGHILPVSGAVDGS